MENFLTSHYNEVLSTIITVVLLLIFRFLGKQAVNRIGRKSEIVEPRILLISKYVSTLLIFLGVGIITIIWGVDFQQLGILFSSVFAVIGVALFAQWSILSNVTAGVILFFSFPFKIGDRVKIMDKEIYEHDDGGPSILVIEDIKAFHVHLRKSNGELLTYPNNMLLQKGVALVYTYQESLDGSDLL
ncbi:MAG: mechanosensitive ion channel domain-containing protein [Flavobacteriaceae bacterium]